MKLYFFELQLNQGPYIYDIHEKCPIFAPLPLPLFFFMSEWAQIGRAAPPRPGTSKLRLYPPPLSPLPIPFGILAKNCIGKSRKYTQCKAVIFNEKNHLKLNNMSTVLIPLLQIVRTVPGKKVFICSLYIFVLVFWSVNWSSSPLFLSRSVNAGFWSSLKMLTIGDYLHWYVLLPV